MSSQQEFKCIFCNDHFDTKEELQIHFRKHGDPNFNQKKYKCRSQDEAVQSPEVGKDGQTEMVECDVCPEVFTTISKAITHKHKVHPSHDTKYFCPWCGKLFTMKHLYNKHLHTSHAEYKKSDGIYFHCDVCSVDFNIPAAMMYHNKFFHRQDDLPFIGNSKKLKTYMQEVLQIFYCPFCGEEFDNKVNLHKHMGDDHSDENQCPDDVLRCPLCDGIFYHLDAYEIHLTYHSVEDLYSERNELLDSISDFSLETVSPIQEKIENAEPHVAEAEVDGTAPIGIAELLEFTMNESSTTKKAKKHKKHKKSKKNTITLDEFLNMNKDVFGEDINVQGIEEVPTQVVAKRLKASKKNSSLSKPLSSDIAKLKRQGIVVKKNAGEKFVKATELAPIVNSLQSTSVKNDPNKLSSSNYVLSKLMNQGSQIKIIKKSNEEKDQESDFDNQTQVDNLPESLPMSAEEKEQRVDMDSHLEDAKISSTIYKDNSNHIKLNTLDSNEKSYVATIQAENKPVSPNYTCNEETIRPEENIQGNIQRSAENITSDKTLVQTVKLSHNNESSNTLRSNSNIAINSSKLALPDVNEDDENDDDNFAEDLDKTDLESDKNVSQKTSIKAFKHLSHLITIKPVSPTQSRSDNSSIVENKVQNNSLQKIQTSSNIKNLSSITIKSTSLHPPALENSHKNDDDHDSDDEWNDHDVKNAEENKKNVDKIAHLIKSPQINVKATKESPKAIVKDFNKSNVDNNTKPSNVNLLRQLKQVTAKSLNINSLKIPTSNKMATTTSPQNEIAQGSVEIFSVEDSDSDEANYIKNNRPCRIESKIKSPSHNHLAKNVTGKSDNKNVSIKSPNLLPNKEIKRFIKDGYGNDDDSFVDSEEGKTNLNKMKLSTKTNQKQLAINNVLKNLSKNITVKSRNSSPSQSLASQEHNSNDSLKMEKDDGFSDGGSPPGRVKITEVDNVSDDEFNDDHPENDYITQSNVKIEHPDDSLSDNNDPPGDEDFDDLSDIESHIEASTVKIEKNDFQFNPNLKNISKNITIKSLNPKTNINVQLENPATEEIPQSLKNRNYQSSVTQAKQPEKNNETFQTINKNLQNAEHRLGQLPPNHKVATSSNQMNSSFNKEVKTVKTFQTETKTVIQEITTTVTKTVKTVNQMMKQDFTNAQQSTMMPKIMQKPVNSNVAQKNFQGVKVRQSAPIIRPRIRGPAPQSVRPTLCAPGVSNQLVPMRPRINRPMGPRSRMLNISDKTASTSGQQRPQGVPVRVSPATNVNCPKRSADPPGHFSCFKKAKESLIPVVDFPISKTDKMSENISSVVQMQKSNFSSTAVKTVKGNSVVTSTQMKSEMSASSQQLSKLRNMSGLSVVKTSQQSKQIHVEEKCEISESQQNTLNAIQKLQSQGLLVKKPRLGAAEAENSDQSNPPSDGSHESNDEFD